MKWNNYTKRVKKKISVLSEYHFTVNKNMAVLTALSCPAAASLNDVYINGRR